MLPLISLIGTLIGGGGEGGGTRSPINPNGGGGGVLEALVRTVSIRGQGEASRGPGCFRTCEEALQLKLRSEVERRCWAFGALLELQKPPVFGDSG